MYRPSFLAIGLLGAGLTLGGCAMPNSSNPTLTITSATAADNSASLGLLIENPSDYDLHLHAIDWELVQGPLPVASGQWIVDTDLPKGASYAMTQAVAYDTPTLDPEAETVELSGVLRVNTTSGDSKMTLGDTSFAAQAPVSGGH